MIFLPKIINNYEIERFVVEDIGRHYHIKLESGEEHLFPSMTTVIAYQGDADYIKAWKKRVGEKVSYAISKAATDAGTELHLFCEYIMLRKFDDALKLHQTTKDRKAKYYMKKILPYLKKYNKVFASEEFLFSIKHRIAGTTDAVVGFDGSDKIYILDFKTASGMRKEKDIIDYYIQTSGYAIMFEEITGIKITDAIILIVNPYGVQEFILDLTDYKKDFLEVVDGFYAKYGNDYQKDCLELIHKV